MECPQDKFWGPSSLHTCTTSLGSIRSYGFSYHRYTDDTQLNLLFPPNDQTVSGQVGSSVAYQHQKNFGLLVQIMVISWPLLVSCSPSGPSCVCTETFADGPECRIQVWSSISPEGHTSFHYSLTMHTSQFRSSGLVSGYLMRIKLLTRDRAGIFLYLLETHLLKEHLLSPQNCNIFNLLTLHFWCIFSSYRVF